MKISVVMASRNPDVKKLADAIKSVLNQTYKDFELIIVDDGSDESISPIVSTITGDERVRVFRIEPSGLGAALNYGIKKSQAKYIARLDDDDLMAKDRLQKQNDFLDSHPNVSCLGTQHYDIVGTRYCKHRHYPEHHKEMVEEMLIKMRFPMAHTALMFRRDSFDKIGGYRIAGGGQDADLIIQMSTVGELANLSEYLTYYNMSATGLGTINPNKKKAYLFAFEEILKQNVYPQYKTAICLIIDNLKKQIAKGQKIVLKNILIRKILALRVILCGKTFHYENL